MQRRQFLALFGSSTALPWQAVAQNQSKPIVGYLSSKDESSEATIIAGMLRGLVDQGLTENADFSVLYRWSRGDYGLLPELAAELVARKVSVIAASGLPAALAATAATSQIPIVFRLAVDPVSFGLVQRFDRPGRNVTGVTMLFDPLTPKKLELIHVLAPDRRIALLVNPRNPNSNSHVKHAEDAARALGLQITTIKAGEPREIEQAFSLAKGDGFGAVLVGDDPLFDVESQTLVRAAAQHGLPTMFYVRDFVLAGGLMSYGPRFDEMALSVGQYVGRILKGSKPSDLPILQPTKFELVVNLKTAKMLGVAVPQSILVRADEIID